MSKYYRNNFFRKIQQLRRLKLLRKIAVDLMPIQITQTEQKIFDLLLKVVQEKTPNTVLRVAGGWVRDKLLGKDSHDIDIAINNLTGEEFARLLKSYMDEHGIKGGKNIVVYENNPLRTAQLKVMGWELEFVNLRTETYTEESRTPTSEFGTVQQDAERRDLTINSLFYNINTGKIEDYVGGIEDLKSGIARTPIDPVKTFKDDPLRILRTIRFASKYGLDIDPEVVKAANDPDVQEKFRNKISKERIWQELAGQAEVEGGWKAGFLTGPDPHRAVQLLNQMGLRDLLFGLNEKEQKQLGLVGGIIPFESEQNNPHHDLNIWEHTLKVLEHLVKHETTQEQKEKAENFLVRNLSALLHDVGKCDLCAIQKYEKDHPEYEDRIQKILDRYKLKHEGNLWTFHGHAESSAKIAEHILKRMGAPSDIIERVVNLVAAHMKPHAMAGGEISDKTLKKFIESIASKWQEDWRNSMDLAIADAFGKNITNPKDREKYVNLINRIDKLIEQMGGKTKVKPPISGKDLISILGFKQGPMIGQAITALNEALLEQPNMTRDEALNFVRGLNIA